MSDRPGARRPGATERIRIGNCSGFYGDRLSAMREMLEGGAARRAHRRLPRRADHADPRPGPAARTRRSATRGRSCARSRTASGWRWSAACRIVANAGGLNPAGLADAAPRARRRRSACRRPGRVTSRATTLRAPTASPGRADRQRLPRRVRDRRVPRAAAPTSWSPAGSPTPRWWSGRRSRTSAGTATTTTRWPAPTVAGHVLECGAQATGGNFAVLHRAAPTASATRASRSPRSRADGSCVITKHPGTGGAVTVDTVTAQLLYEIGRAAVPRPRRVDPLRHRSSSTEDGPDRVRVSGVRGAAAAGRRSRWASTRWAASATRSTFVLTGLDIEAKAALVRAQLEPRCRPARSGLELDAGPHRPRRTPTPRRRPARCCTVHVQDPDTRRGRPGVLPARRSSWRWRRTRASTLTAPPGDASPYGVFTAAYGAAADVRRTSPCCRTAAGSSVPAPPTRPLHAADGGFRHGAGRGRGPTRRVPLGTVVGARVGRQGRRRQHRRLGPHRRRLRAGSRDCLTADRLRELLPEAAGLTVDRVRAAEPAGGELRRRRPARRGVAASAPGSTRRPRRSASGCASRHRRHPGGARC